MARDEREFNLWGRKVGVGSGAIKGDDAEALMDRLDHVISQAEQGKTGETVARALSEEGLTRTDVIRLRGKLSEAFQRGKRRFESRRFTHIGDGLTGAIGHMSDEIVAVDPADRDARSSRIARLGSAPGRKRRTRNRGGSQ